MFSVFLGKQLICEEGQFSWTHVQVLTIRDSHPSHIQTDQRCQTYDPPVSLLQLSFLPCSNTAISLGHLLWFTPPSTTDCKITLLGNWAGATWCQGCMKGSSIILCSHVPINHLDKTWRSDAFFSVNKQRQGGTWGYLWLEQGERGYEQLMVSCLNFHMEPSPHTYTHTRWKVFIHL